MIHVECYSFAPFILNQRCVYLVYFKFKPKVLEVQRLYSAEPKIHVSRLSVWDTPKEEENWQKKKKLAAQKSKFVCLYLLWLDVKNAKGRKEENDVEIKGKTIRPFIAEKRSEED